MESGEIKADNVSDMPAEFRNKIGEDPYEELKNLQKISPKRSFTKRILKNGEGFLRPYLESVCILDIIYSSDDDIFSHNEKLKNFNTPVGRNVELVLGSAKTEAGRMLEKCILTMRKCEESKFLIKYQNKFEADVNSQKQTSLIVLKLTLHDFSETKPTWSLTSEEKYQLALEHKARGTDFFKDNDVEAAFCQYSIAIIYLICIIESTSVLEDKLTPETKHQRDIYRALKCVCYLNLAACQMKVANYSSVIINCTHALSLDCSNVKGLYRRAKAYLASGKIQEARFDLKRAQEIEPKNQAITSLLLSCKH